MSKYIGQNVAVASIKSTAEGRALLEAETVAAQRVLLDTNSVSEVDAKDALRVNLADETYYQQDNILGTVSQTAGVPTGAIIESGSNANGSYTKYADGTLVCTGETIGLATTTLSDGAYFGTERKTFPVAFVGSVPKVIPGVRRSVGTTGIKWAGHTYNVTLTEAALYVVCAVSEASLQTVSYIAIGRWY